MWSLYRVIEFVFWVMDLAILLRVLFSWVNPDPYNTLVRLVYQITEPVLGPLRRVVPPLGGLDITPMIALVLLQLVRSLIIGLLF
jgi:YggT family protein